MDKKEKPSISTQSAELAEAVPQVILNRISKMASAGPQPSLEDITEFNRMWSEKILAAAESWSEISRESIRYQKQVLDSTTGFWSRPWMLPQALFASSMTYGPDATRRLIQKGLEPVHQMAVANAERLNEAANENKEEC